MCGGRWRTTLLAGLLALVAGLAPPASASETGNQVVDTTTVGTADVDFIGQTFTVPAAPVTDDFLHTLRINNLTRPAGTFQVRVTALDGSGLPTGAPLYTSPAISGPLSATPITVYPNITVVPGDQYGFYFDSPVGTGVRSSAANPYPGGDVIFHLISGNAWGAATGLDLGFLAQFSDDKGATITSLNCPANGMVGVASNCTVTVANAGTGLPVPTGPIGFSTVGGNGITSGCAALDGAGQCAATYTPTDAGTHQIFSQYPGDAAHLGSSRNVFMNVARRTTQIQEGSCSPAQVQVGQPVTCAATVADKAPGGVTFPTGGLFFGSTLGGSFSPSTCTVAPTAASGESECAAVTFIPSEPGQHGITASYAGDASHATSSGPVGTVTVTPAPAAAGPDCAKLRKRVKSLKRKFGKAKTQAKKRKLGRKIKKAKADLKAEGC